MIVPVMPILIPYINDVVFTPISASNSTFSYNQTYKQCLCTSNFSHFILNYFPNNTCQYFSSSPRRYRIESVSGARLYFPKQILPNASECCMPDLNVLLDKLYNATPIYTNSSAPRCLTTNDQGSIATVARQAKRVNIFDSTNLTLIRQSSVLDNASLYSIAYYEGYYYVGTGANVIQIIDENSLTIVQTISATGLNTIRDVMFLNNGTTMVVTSCFNNSLLFFNRTSTTSLNYTLAFHLNVANVLPHKFWHVNDSFFYVTSWLKNAVYSYSTNDSLSMLWTENLYLNATSVTFTPCGSYYLIDECNRGWFSLGYYGLQIFDSNINIIGNFTISNASIFYAIITNNYVMYISDVQSNRVIRIDPNINCET